MPRPKIELNLKLIRDLARIGCTLPEIASIVGVNEKTIRRRASDEVEKGQNEMRTTLRRWQYMKAKDGNVAMLIWLGKQFLGQRDKIDETHREEIVTIHPFDATKNDAA